MNIYALKGHRVVVTEETAKRGLQKHQDRVREHLTIGKHYSVERTEPLSSRTRVYLEGLPDVRFNSVMFEDVEPQSFENTMQHPELIRIRKKFNIPIEEFVPEYGNGKKH
jgi:hypothetical protein